MASGDIWFQYNVDQARLLNVSKMKIYLPQCKSFPLIHQADQLCCESMEIQNRLLRTMPL